MDELRENYKFFLENRESLVAEHAGEFAVIRNKAVVGFYGTFDDAFSAAAKTGPLGTFLIQECADEERTTAQFSSNNVEFA